MEDETINFLIFLFVAFIILASVRGIYCPGKETPPPKPMPRVQDMEAPPPQQMVQAPQLKLQQPQMKPPMRPASGKPPHPQMQQMQQMEHMQQQQYPNQMSHTQSMPQIPHTPQVPHPQYQEQQQFQMQQMQRMGQMGQPAQEAFRDQAFGGLRQSPTEGLNMQRAPQMQMPEQRAAMQEQNMQMQGGGPPEVSLPSINEQNQNGIPSGGFAAQNLSGGAPYEPYDASGSGFGAWAAV